jgi:hypothetical protein
LRIQQQVAEAEEHLKEADAEAELLAQEDRSLKEEGKAHKKAHVRAVISA